MGGRGRAIGLRKKPKRTQRWFKCRSYTVAQTSTRQIIFGELLSLHASKPRRRRHGLALSSLFDDRQRYTLPVRAVYAVRVSGYSRNHTVQTARTYATAAVKGAKPSSRFLCEITSRGDPRRARTQLIGSPPER